MSEISLSRGCEWWDKWFLGMAKYVSTASRDPSTKTGAVIVDPKGRIVSVGYNGFAKKISDTKERYLDRDRKMKTIIHCEVNAIVFAKRDLEGCTLYTWPFISCSNCSSLVIQSGITRCVAPSIPADKLERWKENMAIAEEQFKEAGVEVCIVELDE